MHEGPHVVTDAGTKHKHELYKFGGHPKSSNHVTVDGFDRLRVLKAFSHPRNPTVPPSLDFFCQQ